VILGGCLFIMSKVPLYDGLVARYWDLLTGLTGVPRS